jgi:hypothetical protein
MRKFLVILSIIAAISLNSITAFAQPETQNIVLSTAQINSGVIGLKYNIDNTKKIKLLIEKDGEKYT